MANPSDRCFQKVRFVRSDSDAIPEHFRDPFHRSAVNSSLGCPSVEASSYLHCPSACCLLVDVGHPNVQLSAANHCARLSPFHQNVDFQPLAECAYCGLHLSASSHPAGAEHCCCARIHRDHRIRLADGYPLRSRFRACCGLHRSAVLHPAVWEHCDQVP